VDDLGSSGTAPLHPGSGAYGAGGRRSLNGLGGEMRTGSVATLARPSFLSWTTERRNDPDRRRQAARRLPAGPRRAAEAARCRGTRGARRAEELALESAERPTVSGTARKRGSDPPLDCAWRAPRTDAWGGKRTLLPPTSRSPARPASGRIGTRSARDPRPPRGLSRNASRATAPSPCPSRERRRTNCSASSGRGRPDAPLHLLDPPPPLWYRTGLLFLVESTS